MARSPLRRSTLALPALLLVAACASPDPQLPDEPPTADVVVWTPERPSAATSLGRPVQGRAVDSIVTERTPSFTVNASREVLEELRNPFPPTPKTRRARSRFVGPGEASRRDDRMAAAGRATQTTIESIDTQTNIDNTGGFLFIPADAHGAAGPNHVVAVTNVSIEFFQKDGTLQLSTALSTFFSSLSPANATFDPKVLYDQYEDRWLVVTLERTDTGSGDATNSSSILLAVSDDSDPNGSWTQTRIDSSINIGGADHWFDYPGFAVDEEAIYLTGNMFRYLSAGGAFGGVRLFIVDKGTASGFYAGGPAASSVIDPIPTGGFELTMQPAHTYGLAPANRGTWLIGWTGLNAGGNSAYQVLTLDNPLTSPSIALDFIFFGNVDDVATGLPAAPQAGSPTGVSTNDRRTLDAVWRDDGLWVAHSYLPNSGTDTGQVTAAWARLDTSGASPALDQFGFIGGEDIAAGAYTFFPSLAVNDDGGLLLGFSASAPTINVGSYYAYRTPTDAPGTLRNSNTIRVGLDDYVRTFGGASNRWGDYSSAALDPDGACFWIYNKYAITGGTLIGGEDGRWGTAFAHFCNDAPIGNGDAADVDQGQTVTVLASGQASVLANDTDPDSADTLVVSTIPVSGPDHASAFSLNADGSFSYTHDGSANFSDAVVYEVCDDGSPIRCDTATLQVTIASGSNNPPVAVNDTATVAEGGIVSTLDSSNGSVLDNDSDPDGNGLSVNGAASPAPLHAAAFTLNPDGTFSYTHDGSETTSDSFGYEVCDDGMPVECANALVTISITEVNDPPTVNGETLPDLVEDAGAQAISTASLLANDDAGPGEGTQSLTITSVGNPTGGTVVLNGTDIEFTLAANYNGPAGFDYEATDNGTTAGNAAPLSGLASASFTITEVNDPPTVNGESLPALAEDAGLQVIPAATLLANDNAGPGEGDQVLTITSVDNAVGGTVNLNGSDIEFTPSADYNGPAGFDYEVTDNGTTAGNADPLSAFATATFTITEVNDPPIVNGETLSDLAEDAGLQVISTASLLINDDPGVGEGAQSLTITSVSNPTGGTVVLNGTDIEFTLAANYNGPAGFDYAVTDNGTTAGTADPQTSIAAASFTITEANDPPAVNGETLADVAEDAGIQVIPAATLLANDNAGPGEGDQVLTITSIDNAVGGAVNLNGSNIEFTPSADYNGAAGFDYEVTDDGTTAGLADPASGVARADFTVTPVNDPPVAVPEAFVIDIDQALIADVSLNDFDIDSPDLSFAEVTPPSNGNLTLDPDGSFSYIPDAGFFGTDSFIYAVSDGSLSDTATVTIDVRDIVFKDGFESLP